MRFRFDQVLDKAFDWFFVSFVFVTVFLPSGSIYGLNFKYPLYVGLLPLAVFSVFHRGLIRPGEGALIMGVPAILSGWAILALSHGFGVVGVVRQFTDIILTIFLCWLAQVFCNRQESRRLRFLQLVLHAEVSAAALKVGVITYAVLRGIPVVQMVIWLDRAFDVNLMTMDLGALFGRIQFFSDALIPVCIYIVLRHRDRLRIGNLRAALTILLLLISVLFGFSRYIWAFTAFAFLIGLVLGKRDRFQAVLIATLGLSIMVSLPALTAVYQLRFSGEVTGSSDMQRTEQIPALEHFFVDSPFFGHGLGSYTTANIRDETNRQAYEVQLLALPAQIGLFGMFFLIVLGGYYYRELWWNSRLPGSDQLGIALLLVFWIAAGITNPFLIHPIAGVNYATLATLSTLATKKKTTAERSAVLSRFH